MELSERATLELKARRVSTKRLTHLTVRPGAIAITPPAAYSIQENRLAQALLDQHADRWRERCSALGKTYA